MKRLLFLSVIMIFSVTALFAQLDLQPVAVVRLTRSESITVRQLRIEIERFEAQGGRALTNAEKRQILDVMINERLVLQAAERDRVTVTENEVNQQINELRAQMAQQLNRQPTEAEFAQEIRNQFGMDMPTFRESIRRQMITQKYLVVKKEDVLNSFQPPTEADIVRYFNNSRNVFVRPDTVRLSRILVPFGTDRNRARQEAERLARDFDEVVLRGQVQNASYLAGDAGYFFRTNEFEQLAGRAFFDAAFSLRQGVVSGVIESPQGYNVIKVTESYSYKSLELDDIAILPNGELMELQLQLQRARQPMITVRDYIGQGLAVQNQQEVLARATQELAAELRAGNPFTIYENNFPW